ncbi:hypothetical protein [Acinetobacter sp. ANC 5600]|uniref:hypothetical protein n=1 Tax=Acinetobacter sp. ANC 5600 TaxID=1960940 RepID=UPI0009923CC5|nr:hypothetical protein [Acinetobacter sp. ANC 5600]OOV83835.1 hypothetical protein B1201_00880 [Acinetobacter sp. ANC 5600]
MATYKQIQEFIKGKHGITAQPCWIAHVKSEHGVAMRSNRQGKERVKPCPEKHRDKVEEALKHFKMIP